MGLEVLKPGFEGIQCGAPVRSLSWWTFHPISRTGFCCWYIEVVFMGLESIYKLYDDQYGLVWKFPWSWEYPVNGWFISWSSWEEPVQHLRDSRTKLSFRWLPNVGASPDSTKTHVGYSRLYIYIYVWYIYICIYMCIMCICIYVYMYICIYVYMYICIYVYMYICIYVYMYICIYVHMYGYMNFCVYVIHPIDLWMSFNSCTRCWDQSFCSRFL